MRTKALFVAAAFGAAGIVSSMAQVYSVNVVGYVNKTLVPGWNLVANPLETTANNVADLFPGVDGMGVYKYVAGSGYRIANYSADFEEWDDSFTLAPGEGAFVFVPGSENVTVTFVGEITEGEKANTLPVGWSMKSSMVPQSGTLSALGYPVADQDGVYQYRSTATPPAYSISNYSADFEEWDNGEPVIEVGEAFFLSRATAGNWVRNFSVAGN